jgi:hypothetical protein
VHFLRPLRRGPFRGELPNCGGDLVLRPTRPDAALVSDPASTQRVTKPHPQRREPLVA